VEPSAVAVGDLNGDSIPDLATANFTDNTVSILFGVGDGSYQRHVDVDVYFGPTALAIADLNGDGRLDIVIAYSTNLVSVLIAGPGGETFDRTDVHMPLEFGGPSAVAVGDLNGDGALDIVTRTSASNGFDDAYVTVLLGNGDGTFDFLARYGVDAGPSYVALADITEDQVLDIIVGRDRADEGGGTLALQGGGDGRMIGYLSPFTHGTLLAMLDVTGEGKLDFVSTFSDTQEDGELHYLSVLPTSGGPFITYTLLHARPVAATAGDYNGDGIPDLVVATEPDDVQQDIVVSSDPGEGIASLLIGIGEGYFLDEEVIPVFGETASDIDALDADGDGDLDFVMTQPSRDRLMVILGDDNGEFIDTGTSGGALAEVGSASESVILADVNRDGAPDIVAANYWGGFVSVLLGNEDGTFGAATNFNVDQTPLSLAWGDVDDDGDVDIVTANYGPNTASVLLGDGNGGFAAAVNYDVDFDPDTIFLEDMDADGFLDIVTATNSSGAVSATVLFGVGDGTFEDRVDIFIGGDGSALQAVGATALSSSGLSGSAAIGDINCDGRLDIVAGNGNGRVVLGNGDRTFTTQQGFRTNLFSTMTMLGDLNEDGKLDVVFADEFGSDVTFLLGNGDGTFSTEGTLDVANFTAAALLADVNDDGHLDVLAADYEGSVWLRLGEGNGSFSERTEYLIGPELQSLALGDVDRDGDLDIIAALYQDVRIALLLNRTNSTAEIGVAAVTGFAPLSEVVFNRTSATRARLTERLSSADLLTTHEAAIGLWTALGLPAELVGRLQSAELAVGDLQGLNLGAAMANRITVDSNAAGFGWFVDRTPLEDEEFSATAEDQVLAALAGMPAEGGMDLLTVLLHEQGHLLGLGHTHEDDGSPLLLPVISAGARRKLDPSILDLILAHEDW
ncbi:MAG: VCBS repeat-containing protein, partial [Planctomycetes bacterium]|nr:VCBS repeat-containing protein [Planctomycetota bacterium]